MIVRGVIAPFAFVAGTGAVDHGNGRGDQRYARQSTRHRDPSPHECLLLKKTCQASGHTVLSHEARLRWPDRAARASSAARRSGRPGRAAPPSDGAQPRWRPPPSRPVRRSRWPDLRRASRLNPGEPWCKTSEPWCKTSSEARLLVVLGRLLQPGESDQIVRDPHLTANLLQVPPAAHPSPST